MAISTAVDVSARASAVGIQTEYRLLGGSTARLLPQAIALIGQGNTANTYQADKVRYTQANDVGAVYGYGSPLHLAAKQLLPINNDGLKTIPLTVYPLGDATASTPSIGSIVPINAATETSSYRVRAAGEFSEAFLVAPGDTVATIVTAIVTAVNSALDMPVIASDDNEGADVTLTSKWQGETSRAITIDVIGPAVGVTFTLTQPANGSENPDVQPALDLMGDSWETMVVNCGDVKDTTNLDVFQTFGEGRWGALTKMPMVVFTGINEVTVNGATIISSSRTTDRINGQVPAPGSVNLPCEIAARAVARYASVANNKPANDYLRQSLSGIIPGADGEQWNYQQRDQALKAGSSTTLKRAGLLYTEDTSTFYYPAGDPAPAYAKVCQIVKLQNIIYNIDVIFTSDTWAGAPLIPDFQATTNPDAKQPKDAIAELSAMIDQLALGAMISDPETAKDSIVAEISATNPNRLDVSLTVQLSGNTNIISIDLNFGFYFG